MKLVLASYFQPENHGPGRKIGASPGKPRDVNDCESVFTPFVPNDYWDYHKNKKTDPEAGRKFVEGYNAQLESFVKEVQAEAAAQGKSVQELLPFQDGDNLLTWEKKGNLSYRAILAKYLTQLGYEVEEN